MLSNSNDSSYGRLIVTSKIPGCYYQVRDSLFREIPYQSRDAYSASYGELLPGPYSISASIGYRTTSSTLVISPGTVRTVDLDVTPDYIAPVGNDPNRLPQSELAFELSSELARSKDGTGVVILLMKDADHRLNIAQVALYDENRNLAIDFKSDCRFSDDLSSAGCNETLRHGPYILRIICSDNVDNSQSIQCEQTIWLATGWQTLVFIPDSPLGPQGDRLSIHMCPIERTWGTTGIEAVDEIEVLQLKSKTPASWLDMYATDSARRSPLTLICAISRLCLSDNIVDTRHAKSLLVQLLTSIGGISDDSHPDVTAIMWRLLSPEGWYRPLHHLTWPPMLAASWTSAVEIAATAQDEQPITPGTPIERVAASVHPSWPWLQWSGTAELKSSPQSNGTTEPPADAIYLIQNLVKDVANFKGSSDSDVIRQMSPVDLAARAKLPLSLVVAVLAHLDPHLDTA